MNDPTLCHRLNEAAMLSQFKMSVGSTTVADASKFIIENIVVIDDDMNSISDDEISKSND